MFSTIKNKLMLMLIVLGLGFSSLGYLTLKMGNDALMAAIRLTMIGETSTDINACMMELRDLIFLAILRLWSAIPLHTPMLIKI